MLLDILTKSFHLSHAFAAVKLALENSKRFTSLTALPTLSTATNPSGCVIRYPLSVRMKVSITPFAFSSLLIILFFGYRFTDLGPFRAIRYESLKQLSMVDNDFGWTVEMQIKAVFEATAELVKKKINAKPQIMIPQVSSIAELNHIKSIYDNIKSNMEKNGHRFTTRGRVGIVNGDTINQ